MASLEQTLLENQSQIKKEIIFKFGKHFSIEEQDNLLNEINATFFKKGLKFELEGIFLKYMRQMVYEKGIIALKAKWGRNFSKKSALSKKGNYIYTSKLSMENIFKKNSTIKRIKDLNHQLIILFFLEGYSEEDIKIGLNLDLEIIGSVISQYKTSINIKNKYKNKSYE